MKKMNGSMLIVIGILLSMGVSAQKNLLPVSKSSLTGMALPEGTREDKRFLVRAAAKTLMDMEAEEQGVQLGNRYEIFVLPADSNSSSASFIVKEAEAAGWKLGLSKAENQWGWMQKGDLEVLIHIETENKENYLYLGEVKGKLKKVDSLHASETMVQPNIVPDAKPEAVVQQPSNPVSPSNTSGKTSATGFHFTVTNFDDGWTATERENWIEVTKGNMTVLIHFANDKINMSEGQTPVLNANAWDVLVAPKYVSKSDYYAFNGTISYLRSSATVANLTNASGNTYYVVMFRRGGGPFMEFICPDKASFVKEFGVDISQANESALIWSDDRIWMKMDNMQYRNKFAVAMSDLPGYWTSNSFAGVQMYYASTGNYAGMNATAISAEFWLEKDGTYRSEHKGASGMVGNQQVFQLEYKGKYSMIGNWELSITNRHNGKTDVFWCQFECVRGGRILHLTDKNASGIKYHLVSPPLNNRLGE